MICRKCKVDRISKIGLDVMVDATLLYIASLRSEIQTRQEERNHVRPLLQDVTDAVFPPNRTRRREIHIHSILFKNCVLDSQCVFSIPTVPLQIGPAFGEPAPCSLPEWSSRTTQKQQVPGSECEWGSANPESKLFQSTQTKVLRPKFSSNTSFKRQAPSFRAKSF
ncbi:hypothetical protein WA588_005542 [Blastocystis sp. NMH]